MLKALILVDDASLPGNSGLTQLCGGMAGIVTGTVWAWAPAAMTASEVAIDVARNRREIMASLASGGQKGAFYAATAAEGSAL